MNSDIYPGTKITFPNDNPNSKQRPIEGIVDENGCVICISHKTKDGFYPRIRENGKDCRLHRHIFKKYCEDIPAGMVVRHKCDNPMCINPDHLELGTVSDNVMDKIKRGRQWSKLSYEQAYYIKYLSDEPIKELAARFKVTTSTIRDIQKGKTWKHLLIERKAVS